MIVIITLFVVAAVGGGDGSVAVKKAMKQASFLYCVELTTLIVNLAGQSLRSCLWCVFLLELGALRQLRVAGLGTSQ